MRDKLKDETYFEARIAEIKKNIESYEKLSKSKYFPYDLIA